MDSRFGDIFMFLTDLAWKSRLTIPILVTTAFLVMDIRLQIEINIQSGQMNATDYDEDGVRHFNEDDDDDVTVTSEMEGFSSEYTNDDDEDENGNIFGDYDSDTDDEFDTSVNRMLRSLHME